MGYFIIPDWQKGYRYISLGNNLIAVNREHPVPILMTYDPYRQSAPGKSNILVLGRFLFSIEAEASKEYFHLMDGKSHKYHSWGIENKARCIFNKLEASLVAAPLAGEDGFILKVRLKNRQQHPLTAKLEIIYGGMESAEEPRKLAAFSEAKNDTIRIEDETVIISDKLLIKPRTHVLFGANALMDFEIIDFKNIYSYCAGEIESPLVRGVKDLELAPKAGRDIYFVVVFGENLKHLRKTMDDKRKNPLKHKNATKQYFFNISKTCRVTTPDPYINKAFQTAVLNLEYTWRDNLGWMEIVSYWCDLWAQTHLPGACALGQVERARTCLKAHALAVRPDGKAMMLNPLGKPRAGFDWEHFFLEGAYKYYLASNDVEFINEIWPYLRKAYDYCFSARNGKLLLSWGQQLENQEDEIRTYNFGSSATMAGIRMSEIMARFAGILGKAKEADGYKQWAAAAGKKLFAALWKKDSGRFVWWLDELGVEHAEGPYHVDAWPVILGLTDILDSHTSLRHLAAALISPRDIVYNSNLFPEDRLSCLGSPESILVSGIAACAFGKQGDAANCSRIIKGCSHCIMEPPMEGMVPEQARIDYQSYFSSAAANFALGTIAGLFGVSFNIPENRVHIQPAVPDAWKSCRLSLKDINLEIRQNKTGKDIKLKTATLLKHCFRIKLPVSRNIKCLMNGRPAQYRLEPAINGYFLRVESGKSRASHLALTYAPAPFAIDYARNVSPGQTLKIGYKGGRIQEIIDRENVLQDETTGDHVVKLTIKPDLLPGKHTLFLRIAADRANSFYFPLDLNIRSRLEFDAVEEYCGHRKAPEARLKINNWHEFPIKETLKIRFGNASFTRKVKLEKNKQHIAAIPLTSRILRTLTPGRNNMRLELSGGYSENVPVLLCNAFKNGPALPKNAQIHFNLDNRLADTFSEFINIRAAIDHSGLYVPEKQFLSEIGDNQRVIRDPKTGLNFKINGRRLCAIHAGKNELVVPVDRKLKKIYLLLVSYLTAEDMYSRVGVIEVRNGENDRRKLDLNFPGNINSGFYYRGYVTALKATRGLSIVYPATILDIIDIECNPKTVTREIKIKTNGLRPVLGLLAVTGI